MPVLIGGSPSTGSSLLRQLLNSHSEIYCGPEIQLFTHPVLFKDWEKAKMQLLNQHALTSPDFWLMRGVNLVGSEQACTNDDLLKCVSNSATFIEFCDAYFHKALVKYDKRIWVEKTPSNVLSMEAFLNTWHDGVVVHIVRDPKDIVASLIERGLSLFEAAARYIFNTSHGLISSKNEKYVQVKYEDLVMSTESTLSPLLQMLGMKYEEVMTNEGNPNMTDPVQMSGWKSSEIIPPNSKSVGRFSSLSSEEQEAILFALNHLKISDKYAKIHGILNGDIIGISNTTGYAFSHDIAFKNKEGLKVLRKQMNQYRRRCIRERRLFFEKQRPIELIEK